MVRGFSIRTGRIYGCNTFKVVTMITQTILWLLAVITLIGIVFCIAKKKYDYAIALGFIEIIIVLYNNIYLIP